VNDPERPSLDDGIAIIDGELDRYREALALILNAPPEVLRLLRDETNVQLLTARLRLGKLTILQEAVDGKLTSLHLPS
jgi:hypothetical protein